MATISLCVRETQRNADGTYTIKVAIGAKSRTTFIATRFKIDNLNQWRNGKVVRHPDADAINRKLRLLLSEYEDILDDMPTASMSAVEIRRCIEAQVNKSDSFVTYAERYIARLESEGRKSYAKNMGYTLKYLLECFKKRANFAQFDFVALMMFEKYLRQSGNSDTTINIRMSHLKALLNAAVGDGVAEYKVFPFHKYKVPQKAVRDICISKMELKKLREAKFSGISERRHTIARDLFMLSFYCAGINLVDLMDARLDGSTITFVRKKTAAKKRGEKEVSISIQPEAREIIDKYITKDGKLDFGYNYTEYENFRSFVTKGLNRIGEDLGFEKKLMFYSARKTFVQYGTDLGIPLYILEYAIGQTIKDKNSRPIHNYFKVMRSQADMAIRTIISYSQDMEEDEAPIPEWARKYINPQSSSSV